MDSSGSVLPYHVLEGAEWNVESLISQDIISL